MKNKTFFILLFWVIIPFFSVWAQTLNSPRNLNYLVEDENDTYLFWNPPASDSVYIHWDNGLNSGTFDIEGEEFACAVRWDTVNLNGFHQWKIKKIRFFLTNAPQELTIKFWTGSECQEVYSQAVNDFVVNGWNEILLDSTLIIDAQKELRAGLWVRVADTAGVVGVDAGPVIPDFGNLYLVDGQWKNQIAGNWNIQLLVEAPPEPVYLHWDGEHVNNFYGFFMDGYREYACCAKWNPEHLTEYDSWKITSVKYVLQQMSFMELKIKIYEGPNREEVYSQDITEFNNKDWTETILDTPFELDASKDIYVGIYLKTMAAGTPIGMDTNNLVVGQGFWMYYYNNNTWYEGSDQMLNINNNMNIRIKVEPAGKDVQGEKEKSLLGYNVYRDGTLLNPLPVTSTSYVDMNLNNGLYEYAVTAVYDDGESEPCDPVEVLIDQPAILEQDSLALVDLYNQCGGENWFYNDYWLSGPVNEWDGITTEGNRVIGIWLSLNGLEGDLPESLGNLTALRWIHMEGNYGLTSIPQSIGNIDSLRTFWIGYTDVNSIPESIGELDYLRDFMITDLDLSQSGLPETIGNLSRLTMLGAHNAHLSQLPETFGNMDSLKYLYLGSNQLHFLPANFGHLHNMRYLNLQENQLQQLPTNFGEMNKMKVLLLGENQLEALPENFGNLTSLFYLDLNGNYLETLPESFGNLQDLSMFFISNNALTQLPDNFGNLTSLDTLWAVYNQLTLLPESFGGLDDLKELDLSYNMIQQLPESFGDLESVERVRINVNNLGSIPQSIGNLTSLELLSLAVNQIETIPESLGDLINLESLNLNQNLIAEVPASLSNLSNLKSLGLSVNLLETIPSSLGDLDLLYFSLNDNYLAELPATMYDNEYVLLYVQENRLQFGSLEPMMEQVLEDFQYAPQRPFGKDTVLVIEAGSELTYTMNVTGQANQYQWYKDGVALPGFNTPVLHFESVTVENEGAYLLKVTNPHVPDLELISEPVTLAITVGIDEGEKAPAEALIYPNPVAGQWLTVELTNKENPMSCKIFDFSGKEVRNISALSDHFKVRVGDLSGGVYMIRIIYRDGTVLSKKWIKK